jgi:tRNA(Ile)-lysidine synthase
MRAEGAPAPADRVALAVSGGADSVALAWLCHDLVQAGEVAWAIAGIIHVNHGLRGAESDRDEAFVIALAARLGLSCDVVRLDAARLQTGAGRSVEAAAREARDAAFAQAAVRLGATRIATAHTADDQAETVLLRLLRGSALRGVGGIRPRRGAIVRPLLDVRRAALRADLVARGESWCEDSSNADRSIPRNAVRHDLLPVVERLAPGGVAALARFAAQARDDEADLAIRAIELAGMIVLSGEGTARIRRAPLAALSPALGRRVVRAAVETVTAAGFSLRHIDAIRALATADTSGGHLDVPGASVDAVDDVLIITRATGPGAEPPMGFDRPLPVPGLVELPEAGVAIEAVLASGSDSADLARRASGRGLTAAVQQASLVGALRVRNRQAGDRLRPLGAPGRRKVQDVLVDHKVPRHERDRVPIVVDASGQIVWVAGHAMAEECRVTRPESGVVLLKIIDL